MEGGNDVQSDRDIMLSGPSRKVLVGTVARSVECTHVTEFKVVPTTSESVRAYSVVCIEAVPGEGAPWCQAATMRQGHVRQLKAPNLTYQNTKGFGIVLSW